MAATVKTLLENPGELYWGTRVGDPEYHYGIAMDLRDGTLAVQLVYVLTDLDDTGEALVTPDTLMSCFTVADLEKTGIVLSDNMDDAPDGTIGWYCIELSVFNQDELAALQESNEEHDECLDSVIQALSASPEEVQAEDSFLEEYSFFDLLDELSDLSDKIDRGELARPLPFQFHLIGDALLGWQFADEKDFR
ncbi:MAG: hypothetical protein RSB04_02565 [Gordonibacter sp.]|uniref:hypothetical protein n=1 Tax=Gordonibacter sp. TaxID=1968902 RepID=UPI002FC5C01F